VGERQAIVRRIFMCAAQRLGSTSAVARDVGIGFGELRTYISGEAMPPEQVLLKVVEIIIDQIPAIRTEFPPEDWRSLRLP
jgi:hypothetical protein